MTSATSRLLPMPASPVTRTTPWPVPSKAALSTVASARRPTKGVVCAMSSGQRTRVRRSSRPS